MFKVFILVNVRDFNKELYLTNGMNQKYAMRIFQDLFSYLKAKQFHAETVKEDNI